MPRRTIDDLGRPSPEYRPDLVEGTAFETLAQCHTENERRIRGLETVGFADLGLTPDGRCLATLLRASGPRNPPPSLASPFYMREQRIRIGGHVNGLRETTLPAPTTVATVIPRGWNFAPEALMAVDPRRLLGAMRTDMYRSGAAGTEDWMLGILHGEFDSSTHRYQLHVHLAMAGDMIAVVDRLRERPKYKSNGQTDLADGVRFRVEIASQPLTNPHSTLTYLLQPFWPNKNSFEGDDGHRRRGRIKQRIPEPYHSLYLLWLHKWGLRDLALHIGVSVSKEGSLQTK